MKKILLTMIFASTLYLSRAQTVIWSEDFEGVTSAWSLNNGGSGANVWLIDDKFSSPVGAGFCALIPYPITPNQPMTITNSPQSKHIYVSSNVDAIGFGCAPPENAVYVANIASNNVAEYGTDISTSGFSNVSLEFYWICGGVTNADYGQVEYSTNSGSAWNTLPTKYAANSTTWSLATVTNVAFDNQSNLRVRFRWINAPSSPGALDPPFSVDDIKFTTPVSGPAIVLQSSTDIDCFGSATGSATVTVTGGSPNYTYQWFSGVSPSGTLITGATSATVSNIAAGDYYVEVTDMTPVTSTLAVTISENSTSALIASTSIIVDASCNGINNGSVTLVGAGGTSPYTYSLDGIAFVGTDLFLNLAPNSYTGTVKDDLGCTETVMFTIGENYSIAFSSNINDDIICEGESSVFTFSNVNAVSPVSYSWTNIATLVVDEINSSAEATPNQTTTYEGTLTDFNGCVSNVLSYTVVIDNGENITLTGPTNEINSGDKITINADVDDDKSTFVWIPDAEIVDPQLEEITVYPTETTEFIVEVTNSNGCVSYDTIEIVVRKGLEIVTAFTPNGDNVNETWQIKGIENFADATIQIINRWGAMLYETKDYANNEWNGDDAPAASYYYIINLNDGSAELTGTVTIIK